MSFLRPLPGAKLDVASANQHGQVVGFEGVMKAIKILDMACLDLHRPDAKVTELEADVVSEDQEVVPAGPRLMPIRSCCIC